MKQIFFATVLALIFSFAVFSQNNSPGCATIVVSGGGQVGAGTPMSFSASVAGATKNSILEYDWKVSHGTITRGQETSDITVDTTGLAKNTEIRAEVKIKGLSDDCPNTGSEVGSVTLQEMCNRPMDEFGKIPNNEVRARLDALFVALGNEKDYQLYIVNYGTDEEIAAREKLINSHIAFRKYEANRMTFIRGGENPRGETGVWTRAWIIPPGAQPPIAQAIQ